MVVWASCSASLLVQNVADNMIVVGVVVDIVILLTQAVLSSSCCVGLDAFAWQAA